jgi:hypothetical protein
MRIFTNHYSAVLFILTGLFFVPLIETDDVMAKDKYLDEQKSQRMRSFHDSTPRIGRERGMTPTKRERGMTPTKKECLKREKNIRGDGCPDPGDPNQYKGNCGVFEGTRGASPGLTQTLIGECRNNQFHTKHNYEPDE